MPKEHVPMKYTNTFRCERVHKTTDLGVWESLTSLEVARKVRTVHIEWLATPESTKAERKDKK
jgi:hypothetical protein